MPTATPTSVHARAFRTAAEVLAGVALQDGLPVRELWPRVLAADPRLEEDWLEVVEQEAARTGKWQEFSRLLARWPRAAEAYGDDHADHRRQVESTLREWSEEGAVHLAVGCAMVSGLEAHAEEGGGSPDAPSAGSAYAAELARRGQATD